MSAIRSEASAVGRHSNQRSHSAPARAQFEAPRKAKNVRAGSTGKEPSRTRTQPDLDGNRPLDRLTFNQVRAGQSDCRGPTYLAQDRPDAVMHPGQARSMLLCLSRVFRVIICAVETGISDLFPGVWHEYSGRGCWVRTRQGWATPVRSASSYEVTMLSRQEWAGDGRQIVRRPAGCGSRLEGQAVPGVRVGQPAARRWG